MTMIFEDRSSLSLQQPVPQKVSINSATKMVQDLNNKACVFVALGDFAKANHLLGLALEKHKGTFENCHHMDESDFDKDVDYSDEDYSLSPAYEEDYMDDDMESSSSNDSSDFFFDCPRDQEQQEPNSIPSAPIIPSTTSSCGISKMTRCSQVRNVSHPGQQGSHPHHNYHQVYSLPIVVDDIEWEKSSPEDRSFVLVFNSALSNHLWGMKLLSLMGTECHKGYFETAKALYLLALETLWNTGNTAGLNGGKIRSVDKLCVPAIFNNLSHASKVIDGYASHESSAYDAVLLKSVIWWIDGNSSSYVSLASFDASDLRRASNDDGEVVDAFLDTVFHLIGAPESIVPAAAA